MAPSGLLLGKSGGMHVPPVIGLDSPVSAAWHVAWEETYRNISSQLAAGVSFFVFALLILMLYVFDRNEAILLWPLGACVITSLWYLFLFLSRATELFPLTQSSPLNYLFVVASMVFWLMTWRVYFGLQQLLWLRNAIVGVLLFDVMAGFVNQTVLITGSASQGAWIVYVASMFLLNLLEFVLLLLIAVSGIRRPKCNWFLILALFCSTPTFLLPELGLLHIPTVWHPFGVEVPLYLFCELATLFFFFFVLLQRFRYSQRRQQAMADDVEQAR